MERLDTLPFAEYRDQIFKRLEKVANYASLSPKEQAQYDEDMKWAMDYNETVLYQYDQGVLKGIAEGEMVQAWKSAQILLEKNMPVDFISEVTGIPPHELESFIKSKN